MNPILIIEDDTMLNAGLCYNFQLEGYEIKSADCVRQAKELINANDSALLIIDVNLPDGNGFELAKWVRERSSVPMIFLTASDMDEDMLKGFHAGADDYITKPFNIKILVQRVKAILRRCDERESSGNILVCGNLCMDLETHTVKKEGEIITLTPTEYKLLYKFIKNPGMILTRQILLEDLWDQYENFVDEHTLTIHMSRLRRKISDEYYNYIDTVYGIGYRWIGERQG